MASRRKSAKPTNKLRHQLEIEDESEDDSREDGIPGKVSSPTEPRDMTQTVVISGCQKGQVTAHVVTPLLEQPLKHGHHQMAALISEPHIALPSDIYQDFQALKSVTKLDTTELMRRLLKDYHTTSTSQAEIDQKLDDITGGSIPRSVSVLDLSKPKGITSLPYGGLTGSGPASKQSPRFTDDQLAMRALNVSEDLGDKNDVKPLDLTLQKQKDLSYREPQHLKDGVDQMKQTQSYKSFINSADDTQISQSFKRAGSYVINLEPTSESPHLNSSSLARALQMDLPLHSFNKFSKSSSGYQDTLIPKDGDSNQPTPRKATPEISTLSKSSLPLRSKLFHQDRGLSPVNRSSVAETMTNDSSLSGLPSYAEAVTSVLNSQGLSKRILAGIKKETLPNVSSVNKTTQECQSSAVPFVQVSSMDQDLKFIPITIAPQQFPATSSSQDHQKQQQNLLQNLLLHQLRPEHKNLQQHQHQQQLQNAPTSQANVEQSLSNTFCSGQVSSSPGIKPELTDTHRVSPATRSNEMTYPNFLLDPQAVGISSMSSALTNVTMAPSTISTTAVPLSTFFMATSTNGGMGHMVAIPVIHALPDGVTGLQSFAFAPHSIPTTTNTSTVTTPSSSDTVLATQATISTEASSSLRQLNQPQQPTDSPSFTLEAKQSSPLGTAKPKPGRPRGRGGRGQSQKTQNKGMKLLTENTLFPGVYTSILKLPWSRRSRNKTKSKTVSELKKQAQIIAHDKINEDEDHFLREVNYSQEDLGEPQKFTDMNVDHSLLQSPGEESAEAQKAQQDQRENERQHQIEHQKQKDLEQQQKLHMQYHLRLREEQRKLTKQIEQSYLNMSPDSPGQFSGTSAPQQTSPEKQEIVRLADTQGESTDLTACAGSTAPVAGYSLHFIQQTLPKEPVPMVFSNTDINTVKKIPRKRGRPPKIPNPLSKSDSQLTFLTSSIAGCAEQYEPANFLHKNVSEENSDTSAPESKVHNTLSIFPQHMSLAEESRDPGSVTVFKAENVQAETDNEISLEKRIHFLTSQIGLEMTKSLVMHPTVLASSSSTHSSTCDDENGNMKDAIYQKTKMVTNKSMADAKPRRKKVSRLLKSDENFMYATFKIKPKGLTPRKSRRRKKDVMANIDTFDEANGDLRQQSLQDSTSTIADSSKPLSMVAWKFHEQYPCPNEEEETEENGKDRRVICVTCGGPVAYGNEDSACQQCQACLLDNSEISDVHGDFSLGTVDKINLDEPELRSECCLTCGNVFQKYVSDPSSRCAVCISNARGIIRSSRLFTFQDSPSDSASLPSTTSRSAPSSSFLSPTENPPIKEEKCCDKGVAKINNNHLFCSLCRMEFAKICDYLTHMHETKHEKNILGDFVGINDVSRRPRVSKTKKSLAHKTLTCPVEECPHFFREQKDLDLHFMKKHSTMGTCPYGGCGFSYTCSEDLDNHLRFEHDLSIGVPGSGSGCCNSKDVTSPETDKTGTTVSASEKPLQCEFCDYRCRQKNALTWHMRKHPEAASQYRKYSSLSGD